jgi:isocitrate dehydrogenase
MGEKIVFHDGGLVVPEQVVIPFIEGDGIGVDITPAMRRVTDAAVASLYGGRRRIAWREVLLGEKAVRELGAYLPPDALETLRAHVVSIKGPLTTPVGGGLRSLNVAIRQALDLYSCIRPVTWLGAASPLARPEHMNIVIFRENTEDVYAGVEYEAGSPEALRLIALLREFGVPESRVTADAALGLKPIGPTRSKRHVRKALRWALEKSRRGVTFMHKGNIMKFTEGAFMRWGYEVLDEPEFRGRFVLEKDLGHTCTPEAIWVNDRIADNMFQQILTRTADYDLIVTTNLNGDYLSDAAAAAVGGLGMAPGANVGDGLAVFEAIHGSAPKYAGQDRVNPSSLILSAAMMLDYLGWTEAARAIVTTIRRTLDARQGTYDLVRGWRADGQEGLTELSCSEFAAALVDHL